MGIYSDEKVYGISLKLGEIVLIEKTYLDEMHFIEKQEIHQIFDMLTDDEKLNLKVEFYRSWSTTYTPVPNIIKTWHPVDLKILDSFLEKN
jgi:hypothetical protein